MKLNSIVCKVFICLSLVVFLNACAEKENPLPVLLVTDDISEYRWKIESFSCFNEDPLLSSVTENSPKKITFLEIFSEILKNIKNYSTINKAAFLVAFNEFITDTIPVEKKDDQDIEDFSQSDINKYAALVDRLSFDFDPQLSFKLFPNQLKLIFNAPILSKNKIDLFEIVRSKKIQVDQKNKKIVITSSSNQSIYDYALSGDQLIITAPKSENVVKEKLHKEKFKPIDLYHQVEQLENVCAGSRIVFHFRKIN